MKFMRVTIKYNNGDAPFKGDLTWYEIQEYMNTIDPTTVALMTVKGESK